MKATPDDQHLLIELQLIDSQIIQAKAKLASLPEREQIVAIRQRLENAAVELNVVEAELADVAIDLRRMEVDAVPHGFRSSCRDWAGERTNYPRAMAEHALAHVVGDQTELAYRRGDALEKRRAMMEDWAAFCSTVSSTTEQTTENLSPTQGK